MTRTRTAVSVVVAAVVAVAGCSQTKEVAGPAAVEQAHAGGTLRIGILAPRAVAPWLVSAYDPAGSLVVRTMCDQLVQWDVITGDTKPAMAASWRVSTPASIIFKLRKGLTFSDGRKVEGEDLVTSLSRAADSEIASPVGDLLEPVAGSAALRGLRQLSSDREDRERLVGVNTPSPTTVEVKLGSSRADYGRLLGHTLASIVPFEDYRKDRGALERRPVCVGPYQLAEPWSPRQKVIRLTRSASYYARNAGHSRGGRGWADRVEFHVYPTSAEILKAYQRNAVDVAYLDRQTPPSAALRSDLVVAPTPTVEYLGLPTTVPPFDNPDVRRALSLALDRQAIVNKVYGGQRFPLQRLLPPSVGDDATGADLDGPTGCGSLAPAAGNVAQARRLLAGSGVTLPARPLTLYYSDEHANKLLVSEVAAQWRKAFAVTVRLVPLTGSEYITRGQSTKGFDGAFRFSWSPQVPSADAYLSPLFGTKGLGRDNFSKLSDSKLDFVLDQRARNVADDEIRRVSYLLAEPLACSTMAMIPLVQGGRPYLLRRSALASAVGADAERSTGQVPVRELYLTREH